MNNTKRGLIIAAIILNFVHIGMTIWDIVDAFVAGISSTMGVVFVVYDFLSVLGFVASAGLLIYAISNGGQFFRQRNSQYMAAIVINVCLGLFSVSSVLLIISLFVSDMVWVKPVDDVYFAEEPKKEKPVDKERKIKELRELRDQGIITEEEFKDSLMKLL